MWITVGNFNKDREGLRGLQMVVFLGSRGSISVVAGARYHLSARSHLRLEYRDGTFTVRTWQAKVENAEWRAGDGY